MTIEIIEEVMPGTSVIEEIVNLELSVIEGDTAAAEAAAAAAAASAASASGSASTATTQAGIATTKAQEADASATAAETARTGAETAETNAETAQAAAEAARDEITGKVVFTDIQVGDLLQAVDVAGDVKFVRVEPVELLKSTGPFLKSPLAGMVDLDNVFAWDGFNRPDGDIGVSDTGQSWQTLAGSNFVILANRVRFSPSSNKDITVIERTDFGVNGSVGIESVFQTVSANNFPVSFFIAKDLNNFLEYEFNNTSSIIKTTIGGVTTQQFVNSPANVGNLRLSISNINIKVVIEFCRQNPHSIRVVLPMLPIFNINGFDASGTIFRDAINALFPNANDVRYVGFGRNGTSLGTGASTFIYNFKSYNLR